jgi:hypothetical protein
VEFYEDLACQAAVNTCNADHTKEAVISGLAGIIYALVDVASAIREAANLKDSAEARDGTNPLREALFKAV